MLLKYFFISLLVSLILGVPIENEDASNYKLEDEIMKALEKLRKLMKEGDPENGILPLEPLQLPNISLDFYLEETDLKGKLRSTVIENLSDFVVKNLTLNLPSKVELGLEVSFDEVYIHGYYDLLGTLFGEHPVKGVGTHKTKLKGLTLYGHAVLRSKAGIPNVKYLDANFDLDGISVSYKTLVEGEPEKRLEEEFLFHLLRRFRAEYLPILLNTLKIVINDTLMRDSLKDALPPNFREFLNKIDRQCPEQS